MGAVSVPSRIMTPAMAGTAMKPTKDARERLPAGTERPKRPAPEAGPGASAELEAFRKKLLRRARKDPAAPVEPVGPAEPGALDKVWTKLDA